ncbi:MAG TPA: GNAT family N-acetyltransferase [Opitutaceae bacterium]
MANESTREAATWSPRIAVEGDIPAIAELIPASVRELQAAHYTQVQREAAIGTVFGVDSQLVRDGTYFVVEENGRIVGCGGWSRRLSLCGSDSGRQGEDPEIPRSEPARIRAFFVHPAFARRGIGRSLVGSCESAIRQAGYSSVVIMATLPGEPLYAAHGYAVSERCSLSMEGGLGLPVVRMEKRLSGAVQPP